MSTKRIIATALTMIVLATCFTVTPAEAKSSKDEKVLIPSLAEAVNNKTPKTIEINVSNLDRTGSCER